MDKIDEKLSGRSIEYVPLNQALKILVISRKIADNWHKQKILSKKYIGAKVFYSTNYIKNKVRLGIFVFNLTCNLAS